MIPNEQSRATTLENDIDSFMEQYPETEGLLQETVWVNIERRYEMYLPYGESDDFITPKYNKISKFVYEKREERDER